MSSTASPMLNLFVNTAPDVESASAIADGTRSAIVARKKQPGLQSGTYSVVFLRVVFDAAEEKRRPQHEQRVGDDRAGDRRLYQHCLPGTQRRQRDDQFGQVPQRGVEQAADRIARFGSDGLGGMTQQRGQRHDREDRQQKE